MVLEFVCILPQDKNKKITNGFFETGGVNLVGFNSPVENYMSIKQKYNNILRGRHTHDL